MANELLCKICGRYLAVGCQCDSLKKQPCALCDQECADADALQKHMLRYHEWRWNHQVKWGTLKIAIKLQEKINHCSR